MIEDSELFDLCLEKFGVDHEVNITVGEIGEFLTCIGRNAQGRLTHEEMIDEIADVIICMRQMARIFEKEPGEVEKHIKKKMKKKLAKLKGDVIVDCDNTACNECKDFTCKLKRTKIEHE